MKRYGDSHQCFTTAKVKEGLRHSSLLTSCFHWVAEIFLRRVSIFSHSQLHSWVWQKLAVTVRFKSYCCDLRIGHWNTAHPHHKEWHYQAISSPLFRFEQGDLMGVVFDIFQKQGQTSFFIILPMMIGSLNFLLSNVMFEGNSFSKWRNANFNICVFMFPRLLCIYRSFAIRARNIVEAFRSRSSANFLAAGVALSLSSAMTSPIMVLYAVSG